MKDCRIDYKEVNGHRYSVLVDYMNNDSQLYYVSGIKQIKEMYQDFKFMVKSELPIDNYPLPQLSIIKLDCAKYQY